MNRRRPVQFPALPVGEDDPFVPAPGSEPEVARLTTDGLLRRLPGGIHIAAHVADTTALRAAAVLLALTPDGPGSPSRAVIGYRTGAWVHTGSGSSTGAARAADDAIDLVIPPGSARPRRPGLRIHEHRLHPREIVPVGGLRLTTPVRTAADLARGTPGEHVVVLLEALRTTCGVRVLDVLEQLERMAGGRGVGRARALVHAWAGELASGALG